MLALLTTIIIAAITLFATPDKSSQQVSYGRAGSEITAMADGAKIYRVKNGRNWPKSLADLQGMSDSGFNTFDPWGSEYTFAALEDDVFEIRSAGPDGVAGNADDTYWTSKAGLYRPEE